VSPEPRDDVLLLVTKLRPDERLLLDALRAQGLAVRTALPRDTAPLLSGQASAPRLAVLRTLSHREAIGTARRLEQAAVSVFNRPDAIEICNDKGLQALLLGRHGIAHPRSLHAFTHDQVRAAAQTLGWPVVVKPVSGSWGRGVVRLLDEAGLDAWTGAWESLDAAGRHFPVLVQAYIDKPGYDLRVLAVGRDPVVAIRRISPGWRTNTHLGAEVQRTEITDEMAKLCLATVDLLGDGFYGIDLIEDRTTGELGVLEVNATPEFARSSAQHGVDVAGRLAAYLAGKLHG
jgi:[lysine-biosynthesis-protein LysW]---L-2-aminoadipate ligase